MSLLRLFLVACLLAHIALSQQKGNEASAQAEIIQPAGHAEIYLFQNGRKYHIQDPVWFGINGFDKAPVHKLSPAEVDAIPDGYPLTAGAGMPDGSGTMALDGHLISGGDGKIYIVSRGKRHWILDGRWIAESPYAKDPIIALTDRQLEQIPLGRSFQYWSRGQKLALPILGILLFVFFYYASKGQRWAINGNVWIRVGLAAFFIGLIAFREPYLLEQPRFWAEEGMVWFQYGVGHSIWKTLIWVNPKSNYYNLAVDVGAVLSSRTAAHFGLLYAPIATTVYAYLIQAFAVGAILFIPSRLFDTLWKAIAGCLIMFFASTTLDEVWLNTTNSMSFLGAISLFLMFAKTDGWSKWMKWAMRITLVFCALSSPYTAPLLPLYAVMAWHFKSPEQRIQCIVLAACVALQAGLVVKNRMFLENAKVDAMRAVGFRLDAAAVNMFAEHMLFPGVGFAARERISELTGLTEPQMSASSMPPRPLTRTLRAGGWLSAFFIACILYFLRGRTSFSIANLLMAAFLIESFFTCVTALYSVPSGRYAFVPGICFLLLLLVNIEEPHSRFHRLACMAVLSLGLSSGMVVFTTRKHQSGPPWPEEVKKWETDPNYTLRVWPPSFVSDVNIVYPHPPQRH